MSFLEYRGSFIMDKSISRLGSTDSEAVKKPKILHVDDQRAYTVLFRTAFNRYFEITSVNDPHKVIPLLKERPFDAVLTDYEMPLINGLELIRLIKKEIPDMPVIFYPDQVDEDIVRDAFISGAADYFLKSLHEPAQEEKLINLVKTVIEKRRAENALKESTALLQRIMENLPEVLYERDRYGRFIYISPAAEKITGFTQKELMENSMQVLKQIFREPEFFEKAEAFQRKVLEENVFLTADIETYCYMKNGEKIWVHNSVFPFFDENGIVAGFHGKIENITERKQAEQALRYRFEAEKLISMISGKFINIPIDFIDLQINDALRMLAEFENADCAFLCLLADEDGIVSVTNEWSRTELKMKGDYHSAGIRWIMDNLKKSSYLCIPEVNNLPSSAKTEKVIFNSYGIKSALIAPLIYDEKFIGFITLASALPVKWSADSCNLIKTAANLFTGTIARKRTEESLRESEMAFRALAESTPAAIFIIRDNSYVYVNPAFTKITGFDKAEVEKLKIWDILHPDTKELLMQEGFGERNKRCTVTHRKNKIITRDGSVRFVDFSLTPIKFGGKPAILGTAIDVTDGVHSAGAI